MFCMSKLGLAVSVLGEREVPACSLQASPFMDSTLITSAPHSARMRAVMGPASMVESSTTLIPSIGFINLILLDLCWSENDFCLGC